MFLSRIKSRLAAMFTKTPADPYVQKYAAQARWYIKQGLTARNPRLANPVYIRACRELGLDPLWEKVPAGFNRDWTFVVHNPPLWATRSQIFPAARQPSDASSQASGSSRSSSQVSFKDTIEVIPRGAKVPQHATLQPLKGALKQRRSN